MFTFPSVNINDSDNGVVISNGTAQFTNGTDSVTLQPDPLLTNTYTYNFPALAPTDDAQIITTSGSTNVFYSIHAKNEVYVRLNP